ncbi:FAD binding domain-containing protein [Desulfosporosinus nitroreducens]|uniref:Xanthine dehydrogenase family protein subunit M n=1 Tax=Desulfosporosinus nitroreducens TaxID=2018668 RepID=A0ABT8QTM3_9FIRM|nr:xanthine dehydrogenase family protein subunit M [Desulfosporosinus nitroreducens]MDO0824711.1 xanthine dehydrogenase family protein subunit M [Desulfosporosinus nitroreducens]
MKAFAHMNACSVEEVIQLLAKYQGKAKLNAGGTDLLGVLKDRILPDYPELIINIKTITQLNSIEENDEELRIGALTPLINIIASPLVEKTYSILKEAAVTVASPQIRNMATMGGNLCQDTRCWYYRYPDEIGGMIKCFRKGGKTCPAVNGENRYHAIMEAGKCFAVCPSDMAVVLTVLGATLTIAGGGGTRDISVEEFFTPMGNVLAPDEMITMINIPKPSPVASQNFLKFTLRKPIDFAIVSAASLITRDKGICIDARVILGAVASKPIRAIEAEEYLRGKELSEEVIAEGARLALVGAKPLSKNAYKVEIAKTLVKRAVAGC